MSNLKQEASTFFAFKCGAMAGIVALIFSFIVRLGSIAPFAPETATLAFIGIVPASIEQPMVQALGDTAGLFGLAIASIIAIIVYGVFGVLFQKFYSPWISKYSGLTRTEQFLIYAIVPWLFFGLVVFPLTGASFFGITSTISSSIISPYTLVIFPLALLFSQLLFSLMLASGYKSAGPVSYTHLTLPTN